MGTSYTVKLTISYTNAYRMNSKDKMLRFIYTIDKSILFFSWRLYLNKYVTVKISRVNEPLVNAVV
jgi:hypothetical protein